MRLNLRLWQWLVLLALLLADIGLMALALPVIFGDADGDTIASAYSSGAENILAPSARTPTASISKGASQVRPYATPVLSGQPGGPRLTPNAPPPTPLSVSSPAPTSVLAVEAHISGIRGHPQSFSLSCEARSAADWAGYFGVAVDETDFLYRLPASDNPDYGFVGDVNSPWGFIPPEGYGVHAGPVASLLREYGLNAYAHRGLTWDDLRAQIAAGQPVIAWVVGHVERGWPETYTPANWVTVTVARYEHTVIVTGYTADSVVVLDGVRTYARGIDVFLESWSVLGNMAIVRGLLPALQE